MVTIVKRGSGASAEQWFRGIVRNIDKGAQEGLEEVSRAGEEQVKNFITSRPARTSGPRGRYDTGEMYNSVASRTGSNVSNFGWLNNPKNYFILQEGGFTHANSGQWVEGMYAVSDAADSLLNGLRGTWMRW